MAMEMLKGLGTTLKEFGKKPTTVSYPEEKRQLPPRFRGRHVLHRYENGLERCVGCFLCAGACPADAIYIEAEENTDEQRVSPGERYARVFDVNLLRCIFCGYCEQACPTGAITLENIYELASTHPEDLVYHKEQLLEPVGSATRGSIVDWTPTPPEATPTPLPGRQGYFDGLEASAAAVGQGDMPAEQAVFLGDDLSGMEHRRRLGEPEEGE
ncbi:MAG: NADH-ubiquinone oxidoreductase chain I [Ktedonobacterales bacterium]|jgi:NADH-quinone oxidoreductase subunit I|nr:MAG: NADH-ubiquinone oxidoreductase chain I [Ktedonobacterales bacterium]